MSVIYSVPHKEIKELVFGVQPPKKRVFLIWGQEGSGTYMLWNAVFEAIKLSGEDIHTERWSVLHAHTWPQLYTRHNELVREGYLVHTLLIIREPRSTIKSINARRDKNKEPLNLFDYIDRFRFLLEHFDNIVAPKDIISYEMFVNNINYRKEAFEIWMGLPYPEGLEIYDGNQKYYKGDTNG